MKTISLIDFDEHELDIVAQNLNLTHLQLEQERSLLADGRRSLGGIRLKNRRYDTPAGLAKLMQKICYVRFLAWSIEKVLQKESPPDRAIDLAGLAAFGDFLGFLGEEVARSRSAVGYVRKNLYDPDRERVLAGLTVEIRFLDSLLGQAGREVSDGPAC